MQVRTQVALLLTAYLVLSAFALPLRKRNAHTRRVRRKVGQLNVTSTPVKYMRDLLSNIADEEGKPTDLSQNPTTVWCFRDEDIVEETVREKPRSSTKCTSFSRYVFRWESLASPFTNNLQVQKGILRAYVQVITRLLADGEAATLDVAVFMNAFANSSTTTTATLQNATLTDQQTIHVLSNLSAWQEINITEGVQSIWPPSADTPLVEIILRLQVNCDERRKVPVNFINPAEISLEQINRRNKHVRNLEPLMLVFLDNKEVKEKLRKEEEQAEIVGQEKDITQLEGGRAKRALDGCKLENFTINFAELRLDNILSPHSANIRMCTGSCSHTFIKLNSNTATNHAKMMASTYALHKLNPAEFEGSREPCCVPTMYDPLFLLMQHHDQSIELNLYPDFLVKKCGCR